MTDEVTAEEWNALYEAERTPRSDAAERELAMVTAQRDRLRQAMLDMGVRREYVDLIALYGARIQVTRDGDGD